MNKNGYLPSSDSDRATWLKNLSVKLRLYATILGISESELESVTADSAMFSYSVNMVDWFKKESSKRVAYKNLLADGDLGSPLGDYPLTGTFSDAPATVPAGIFKRTAKLVQRIKNNTNYTLSIGEDLGIEAHETAMAYTTVKPELRITFDAGKPVLKWKKGAMVATDLYVDRSDEKGFQFLATCTIPHFTDQTELPTGTNLAQWQYKAIYKSGNEQTGEFSDPVTVAVTRHI